MSSRVCKGLQSCLEPSLVESCILRLKLAPPKTNFPGSIVPAPEPKPIPNIEEKNTIITKKKNNPNDCNQIDNQNIEMGGWSFLQSLANASDSTKHDKVYIHPLVKKAATALSERSLEMCTESLGSETGSEVSESSDDISLLSVETPVCNSLKARESLVTRKMSRNSSFPPPLTSIRGLQVKSYREDGRLVLEAVSIPPCQSYFHAERNGGRLRLSLLKDVTALSFNNEDNEEKDEEEVEEEDDDYDDENEDEDGIVEEEQLCWESEEEMEGNGGNVGCEIETGKLPRPSSCKESGHRHKVLLNNWEPFLVAT